MLVVELGSCCNKEFTSSLCLAAQEKAKPKVTAGLFGGDDEDDDEDGDIFSVGSRPANSQQGKKVVAEEDVVQPPEKKVS